MKQKIRIFFLVIIISMPVMSAINYTPGNPLPEQSVQLTINHPLVINVLSWDFGDGMVVNGNNKSVSHTYQQYGNYLVKVRYKTISGMSGTIFTETVNISVAERRQVIASPPSASPGQKINFQAINFFSGSISWNFGDGKKTTGNNTASHQYTNPGTYEVSAKEYSGDSKFPIKTIISITENRTISFTPAMPSPGDTVSFNAHNFVSGNILWNFGDGTPAIRGTATIQHKYSRSGTFQVSATDNNGSGTRVLSRITVNENKSISANPSQPQSGEQVHFIAHNFKSDCVLWNFGDNTGNIRGNQSMTHIFNTQGRFIVQARDFCGDSPPVSLIVNVINKRSIIINQTRLYTNEPVYFTAKNFNNSCIAWDFGDSSSRITGQAMQTHIFRRPGNYTVRATDDCGSAGAPSAVKKITIIAGQGPVAPFRITYLRLRFEDGKTSKLVRQGDNTLQAVADIKFEGTGNLMVQWLVDGHALSNKSVPLSFAGEKTIKSGLAPPLPTQIPGRHTVSLKLHIPQEDFVIPQIVYTVTPKIFASLAPKVTHAFPPALKENREYLLKLKGENFTDSTSFNPGAGIALLEPPRITSNTSAELKIFVSRNIKTGIRFITAKNASGFNKGPGKLFIGKIKKIIPEEFIPDCPDIEAVEVMGITDLSPDSFDHDGGGDNSTAYNPHILSTDSVLSWEPSANKSAVSFYEVEFYKSTTKFEPGKILLLKKQVPGKQTFLKSSYELIRELKQAFSKNTKKPVMIKYSPCSPEYRKNYKVDITWKVKGYKIVLCPWAKQKKNSESGIQIKNRKVLQKKNTIKKTELYDKLQTDDQWPKKVLISDSFSEFEILNLPDSYTGVQCPADGKGSESIALINTEREKEVAANKEIVDNNSYTMEKWKLTGSINTGYSPVKSEGDIIWLKQNHNLAVPVVGSVKFSNIFIDWGDGTVEKLEAEPACEMAENPSGHGQQGDNLLRGPFNLNDAFHYYEKAGDYTVRVFQISSDLISGIPLTDHVDPEHKILVSMGNVLKNQKTSLTFGDKKKDFAKTLNTNIENALNSGILYFCQTINITNREDLCATGPLNLKKISITGFPAKESNSSSDKIQLKKKNKYNIKKKQLYTSEAIASTCDEFFTATAKIDYFGTGTVKVKWYVDNTLISSEIFRGLSSEQRESIKDREDQRDCSDPRLSSLSVDSPALPVSDTGRHKVMVTAVVVPELSSANTDIILSDSVFKRSNPQSLIPWGNEYSKAGFTDKGIEAMLMQLKKSNKSFGLKSSGNMQFLNFPPVQVSGSSYYNVIKAKPGRLCKLFFPTTKGDFTITNIEGRLNKSAQGYSGEGILILPFTSGSDNNKEYGIPLDIKNWTIDETSGEVISGTININTEKSLASVPSVNAVLKKIRGKILNSKKEPLSVRLDMTFRNRELRFPGDKDDGTEKPPFWSKTETLSSEGNWLAQGELKEILLSWSSFKLSSDNIFFDFHKLKHAPSQGLCSTPDKSWVGVDLGNVTIKPYTFDLIADKILKIKTKGFIINDYGVCGYTESGPYSMAIQKGKISFDKILFTAKNGNFDAKYKNLRIKIPWLDSELKGDATLNKSSGKYGLDFSSVTSPVITKEYNQFTLSASDLRFTTEKNIGWVIRSTTKFTLKSENKKITEFSIPAFFYGFDGYPYFSEGIQNYTIDLGQNSKLGDTDIRLKNVTLKGYKSGPKAMSIIVPCEAFLSENPVIPAADTQLDYTVYTGTPLYTGSGPAVKPFRLDVAFPIGNPSIHADMSPEYTPGGNSDQNSNPGSGPYEPQPAGASFSGTRFYGHVDMSMFGGPPVEAQLLLGYESGKSYFLVRGDIPLGPSGIPMSPLPFSLFRLSGGLGYNFPVDSFHNMSIENARPDMSGKTLFMAGMRIGSADKFTFTLDGITTVKTSGEASLKLDAWLLTHDHSGNGQLQGVLQYGNKTFFGKVWGNLNLMNNMVGINLGNSFDSAAMDLYFGHGDWHIYAGQKDGQRIEAKILGKTTSEGYLMLGNKIGLAAGGRQNWEMGGSNSAYVKGYMDMGLKITTQPKITGNFSAAMSAGICLPKVGCISGGINAQISVSALPLDMSARAELDLPWPAGSVSFTVNL